MSDATILHTNALGMSYGKFVALADVNLKVKKGSIHTVIGPNGAGKTTLFHCLTGNRTPTTGQVFFEGNEVTLFPSYRRIEIGMARSFQITSLFQNLTVRENLRLAVQGRTMGKAMTFWRPTEFLAEPMEKTEKLLKRLELGDQADVLAGELSHGQQRILEVGMAMAASPRLLLLDEPTSGMGINDIPYMIDLIKELSHDHTVLLIEHNMSIVMSISNTITVMNQGQILVEGSPELIQNDQRVRTAYLGEAI